MNDRPTCGTCGKVMTPQNSTISPEFFLCDVCAGRLVGEGGSTAKVTVQGCQPIMHLDCHPGLTMDPVRIEERVNCDGVSKYWYAEQDIGTIFGASVEGVCHGFGKTREQALENLKEDVKKLHDSLWY